MNGFVYSLLVVVLLLVLLQYLLDAVGLADPARKIIWFIAVVVGVLYLVAPGVIR
jgi:uncharacterized membrane protein